MTRKTKKTAGATRRPGFKKIAVDFPQEVFDKIRARADASGVSFSVKASELAACGIRDYEDSERHDRPADLSKQGASH